MIILVFFLFLFFNNCAAREKIWSCTIDMAFAHDAHEGLIDDSGLQPRAVDILELDADIPFSEREVAYYLGFTPGMVINNACLKKLLLFLAHKEKFKTILIGIEKQGTLTKLKVVLRSNWTMGRLKIVGDLLNKESYKKYYLLEEGALFDEQQHKASLCALQKKCKEEGYYSAVCTAECKRNDATKAVDVIVSVNAGKKFIIEKMDCDVDGLKELCAKNIFTKSTGSYYSKKNCEVAHDRLKKLLAEQGYYDAHFECKEYIDHERAKVKLFYSITLVSQKKIAFTGNKFFSSQKLREHLLKRWTLSDASPEALVDDLHELYWAHGFFNAKITVDDNFACAIEENEQVVIDKILFEGVEVAHRQEIEKFFKTILHKFFNKKAVESSMHNLVEWYQEHGFWQAEAAWDMRAQDNGSTQMLAITVVEGKRFLLSNDIVAPLQKLKAEQKKVTYELQRKGCFFTRPEICLDNRDDNTIQVSVKVPEHEPVTFGKTVIVGNDYFLSDKLLEHLSYQRVIAGMQKF